MTSSYGLGRPHKYDEKMASAPFPDAAASLADVVPRDIIIVYVASATSTRRIDDYREVILDSSGRVSEIKKAFFVGAPPWFRSGVRLILVPRGHLHQCHPSPRVEHEALSGERYLTPQMLLCNAGVVINSHILAILPDSSTC